MESDRIVTTRGDRDRGWGGDYDVRRTSLVEWNCDYNSRMLPNRSKTGYIRSHAGQLPGWGSPPPFTSPLLHPFTGAVFYLTPISVSLPLSATSPCPALPLISRLSYSPRRVVGYGNGIRIVISNRATTHEPLPCRSKFVNGLRIPGLPRGSY